jgi:acetyltransferase
MSIVPRNDELHRQALEYLLHPRSVAVIGASGTPTRLGGVIVRLLARHRFAGSVFPVNPKYEEIEGFACYPSLVDIPAIVDIDVAIIFLAAESVIEVVEQCARRGVKALIVLSSGFAEVGDRGETLQRQLVNTANRNHLAVAGPNCAGIANFREKFIAYGTTNFIDRVNLLSGTIAILTASGGLGNTVFTFCEERGVGVSYLIGLGNESVTTAGDYLESLVDDERVTVILCSLEAVRDPKRFFAAADRAAAIGKPVVVLKGGRSAPGKQAIMTHTAALGGSAEAYAAAFRKHGIVQVRDLDELADCGLLFSRDTVIPGPNLGVFSLPGGATSLLSDLATDYGFRIPELSEQTISALSEILPAIAVIRNPLDPTAGFARDSAKFRATLQEFAKDPEIDVVLFFPLASQVDYAQQIADDVVAACNNIDKTVIVVWTAGRELEEGAWRTLREAGIPLFLNSRSAMRALAHVRRYSEMSTRRLDPGFADFGPQWPSSGNSFDVGDAVSRQASLREFGITFPDAQIVTDGLEASRVFTALNGPVAMKIVSADLPHKTEANGVLLNIASAKDAETAFNEIMGMVRAHSPSAKLEGVEMQQMISGGVEVILGISTDDQLGPILSVGLGGIFTKLFKDFSQRPIPISRAEAWEMLDELRGRPLFDGYRGKPAVDTPALVETMLGLSAFAYAYKDLNPEIDLNPVIVLPDGAGALAVDSLVYFGRQP